MKNRKLKSRPRQLFQTTIIEDILTGIGFVCLSFAVTSVVYLATEILGPVIGCWLDHIHSYVLELFSFDYQCK